jgi:hypothetical protein
LRFELPLLWPRMPPIPDSEIIDHVAELTGPRSGQVSLPHHNSPEFTRLHKTRGMTLAN